MKLTPSQVGKMVVAYTLTSATALATQLSASPSASPSVVPCGDIHGNCDAWHACTVDNQNCIWGIGVALFTVGAVLTCAVTHEVLRRCKQIKDRHYSPTFGVTPAEEPRFNRLIEERCEILADQPDTGAPLNSTLQNDYQATIAPEAELAVLFPKTKPKAQSESLEAAVEPSFRASTPSTTRASDAINTATSRPRPRTSELRSDIAISTTDRLSKTKSLPLQSINLDDAAYV